ncbi:MAG: ABC transporter ATP-binding protein [Cytophagales bacterium]|nr:ABC transporter ATP-binding protein [Cytophagales bacterium]
MNDALLAVAAVSKTYPGAGAAVLHEVSLQLGAGELLALTGESGSGKTTLLRLVAGLEEPDGGTILLNGRRVEGPARKLIAGHPDIRVVFQDFRLFPNVSVAENIRHALRQYDAAYRDRRLREMLALGRLEGVKDRLPRQLSGGEQQRAALARALADEPALLLMDEPFSNLDTALRHDLRREIRHMLSGSGCGVILVTHEPADALSMADRVVLLRAGRVQQSGSPRDLYHSPRTAYAARFFGPVNLLPVSDLLPLLAPSAAAQPLAAQLAAFTGQTLCLRPEHLRAVPPAEAHLGGTVRAVTFYGAYEEAQVQAAEGFSLLAHGPVGHWQPGEQVWLRLGDAAWHLLAE